MVDPVAPRTFPRAVRVSLLIAGLLLIVGNGLCASGALVSEGGAGGTSGYDGIGFLLVGMFGLILAGLATLVALVIGISRGTVGARPSLLVFGSLGLDVLAFLLFPRTESMYAALALWVLAIMAAVAAIAMLRGRRS